MSFSRITYTFATHPSTTFAINFTLGYLAEADVTARVNEEVDGGQNPVYRTITFITSGTVSFSGTWISGDTVVFERTTTKDELEHDYDNGALIEESNLDDSNKQAIMIAHEALDGRFSALTQDLDLGNNQILNLADGVLDTDAATLGQIGNAPAEAAAAAASAVLTAADVVTTNADVVSAAASAVAAAASAAVVPLHKFDATSNPTITNDDSESYSVGSRWVNVSNDTAYICLDAATGAAIWEESSLTTAELGALALLNTVTTAVMDDGAVTLAKMASGIDGNLISYDASGAPVAVATGDAGEALISAGVGQPPAFGDILTTSKAGSFSRDMTTASGTQAITGVGFTPSSIIFLAGVGGSENYQSTGFASAPGVEFSRYHLSGGGWNAASVAILLSASAGITQNSGSVSSLDADGFTITWTKVGSPTGTANIAYIAIR